MVKKLETVLQDSFHEEYAPVIFEALRIYFSFCDDGEHILVDARKNAALKISIEPIKKICSLISQEFFAEFLKILSENVDKSLMIYLYGNKFLLLIDDGTNQEEHFEEAVDTITKYLKIYSNGLLVELYDFTKKSKKKACFVIKDGEAKILTLKETAGLLEELEFVYDEWLDLAESDESDQTVVFIDSENHKLFFDALPKTYEELRDLGLD